MSGDDEKGMSVKYIYTCTFCAAKKRMCSMVRFLCRVQAELQRDASCRATTDQSDWVHANRNSWKTEAQREIWEERVWETKRGKRPVESPLPGPASVALDSPPTETAG